MSMPLDEQYDKIYRYCYFKVKNAYYAEDLTQETFLRFFAQKNYISRGKPLAYLYTIAKNLCVDFYRKNTEQPLEETADGSNTTDMLDDSIALKQAVAALPHDCREILLLRFSNALSMKEISAFTGLSRFAARRKINNALEKLKTFLGEEFLQ